MRERAPLHEKAIPKAAPFLFPLLEEEAVFNCQPQRGKCPLLPKGKKVLRGKTGAVANFSLSGGISVNATFFFSGGGGKTFTPVSLVAKTENGPL